MGALDELVKMDVTDSRERITLNVRFDFPPIQVDLPTPNDGPWQFKFTDYSPDVTMPTIKKGLGAQDEEHYIGVVLFESDDLKKVFHPHRFKIQLLEYPSKFLRTEFVEAVRSALQRVMTEMEIRLRQSCFRVCDPHIGYGRVIDLSSREVTTTHRARFMQ